MNRFKEIKHYLMKEKKTFWNRLFWLGKALFRNTFFRYSQIPYLEVFITTQCNLRCIECSNLIPQLRNRDHIDADEVISNIENLLRLTSYIYRLKLHGGEIFLHPELPKIIRYLLSNKKIISIRMTTNGMIVPYAPVLEALEGSRIVVQISDYEISSNRRVALIDAFKKHNIKFVLLQKRGWRDMGDFSLRESNRFADCTIKRCTSMYRENIYVCSRAAMALKEQKIPTSYHIGISNITRTAFKHDLQKLFANPNEACSHCDGDTKHAKPIPAGKQLKP